MNILVTGKGSFLFRALNASGMFDNDNLYEYEYGVDYTNIDRIFHFGSPANKKDFSDNATMAVSMIDYTVKIMAQALANKAEVVFASSYGVNHIHLIDSSEDLSDQDRYNLFKLSNEEYIRSFIDSCKLLVLRIPRVYDLKRKSGLVGNLLDNEVPDKDMDRIVDFITVDTFLDGVEIAINKFNTTEKGCYHEFDDDVIHKHLKHVIPYLKEYWGS